MDIQPPSLRAKRSNPARCVGIEPRHLSLLELEARDCRYPYGGDRDGEAITFCGHLRREDSSYCAAHFHLTRNVESAPERSAIKVLLRLVEAASADRRHCRQNQAFVSAPSPRASARADPATGRWFDPTGRSVRFAARPGDAAARQRKSRAMNRPWMPLYVGDYLGDTGHLTTTQHGAYLLLMMHYWRKGELPDDDRQLSKIAKLPLKTWCDYRATLQDFFYEGWKHKRIDAELAKMMRVSEKRAIAGQKGGLGSALARMKLENASRSRQALPREVLSREALSREVLPRAIAVQPSSAAVAGADHSHPDSHQSLPGDESPGETRRRAVKPEIAVSSELAAYVAKRT